MKIILVMLVQSSQGSGALAADVRFTSRIMGYEDESATPEVTWKTCALPGELLMENDHQWLPEPLHFIGAVAAKESQYC